MKFSPKQQQQILKKEEELQASQVWEFPSTLVFTNSLFVCLFVCLLLFFITLNCKSCSPGVSSEPFTNCINLKSKNCLVIRSVLYSSHDINSFFDRIAIRDLRHFENIFREQNATKTNCASLRCKIFAFCCLLFWRTHTWILTTEAMNSLKHEKENNKNIYPPEDECYSYKVSFVRLSSYW